MLSDLKEYSHPITEANNSTSPVYHRAPPPPQRRSMEMTGVAPPPSLRMKVANSVQFSKAVQSNNRLPPLRSTASVLQSTEFKGVNLDGKQLAEEEDIAEAYQ
ncbi:hypothetical protein HK101_006106 [Irineochytrium annulatum]|nr:hypothetical protein HK101_006106 [Irineochytrium annulatum]